MAQLCLGCDISLDYQITPNFALNLYYAHSFGKSVVAADYPTGNTADLGYLELVYKWGIKAELLTHTTRKALHKSALKGTGFSPYGESPINEGL